MSLDTLGEEALEKLCRIAFYLRHVDAAAMDWDDDSAASMRRFLRRVDASTKARYTEFLDAEDSIDVPGRHAARVAQIPKATAEEIVSRLRGDDDDDVDDDDDDDGEVEISLELELLPEDSKLILRWCRLDARGRDSSRARGRGPETVRRANPGPQRPRRETATRPVLAQARQPRGPKGRPVGVVGVDSVESLFPGVGGLFAVKQALYDNVYLPLQAPEAFRDYGVTPERGILLYGPPGNGKTEIARQFADAAGFYFKYIGGPELLSKWMGETEESLRQLFAAAEKHQPAIIFFDELEVLGARRDRLQHAESGHVQQLLTLTDGVNKRGNVVWAGS